MRMSDSLWPHPHRSGDEEETQFTVMLLGWVITELTYTMTNRHDVDHCLHYCLQRWKHWFNKGRRQVWHTHTHTHGTVTPLYIHPVLLSYPMSGSVVVVHLSLAHRPGYVVVIPLQYSLTHSLTSLYWRCSAWEQVDEREGDQYPDKT